MPINPALREQEPHGSALFPLRVHEFPSDTTTTTRVPAHWHPEVELLVVTKGQAIFHVDGSSWQIQTGDIVFVAPDRLHAFTAPIGIPFVFFAVVFDPAFLNSSVADNLQLKYLDPVLSGTLHLPSVISPKNQWYADLRQPLDQIRQAAEKRAAGFELIVKAQLYLAWAALITHAQTGSQPQTQDPSQIVLVKNVLTYIRTHFDQPLSAALLAKRFAISESHLCRLYKAATKANLTESINGVRIAQSIHLLTETNLPISQIAMQCGFSNISYFNKRFKARLHQTPSGYRQEKRNTASAVAVNNH